MTHSGSLIRADNVSSLNTAGIKAMWDYGVKAVLDLRSEQEIAKFPSPFVPADYGPLYLHVPLVDDAFADELAKTPAMADRYRLMLDHRQEALGQIFKTIARVDGPLVFHCFAGKDRTGLVAAMVLGLLGVDDETIANDYAATATVVDLLLARLHARAPDREPPGPRIMSAEASTMHAALDWMRIRHGSVEGYTRAHGLTTTEISALRDTMIEP